ncbi:MULTISPECIES: phage repressor protein CI [Photorhabdus]|uniref:Phage repressor protein n=3 Tax=Photorhabdus TaxID=29487 RepID=A0ABX0B728_9GAMM|nr:MULTISPECIES: phage repressor protein CI [Photorhabdus]AKH63952.1 repressor [Photorhabdus thracensis]MCC8374669.1 phage repressor protein CI [Photorhabdus bodei]MDB6373781.1 phage repressor protein CI [Photorhabdus bodei]NDL13608.1 phage repressor protein [Photorhabdus kayaii]NDL27168.1 phage repressor protein [Photorhabdus kayaii]
MNLQIDLTKGGDKVLDRIIEAYGFSTKIALAEHFGIASSSLAMRYKRGFFPSDIVVQCMAETGATLEWLATGQGRKFNDEEIDMLKLPNNKLIDGKLYQSGYVMFDKVMFTAGIPFPSDPFCVLDSKTYYIIDRGFADVYDGKWLIKIKNKISIRELTRIPVRRVRVSGVGMAFDCDLDEINVLGRVVKKIKDY